MSLKPIHQQTWRPGSGRASAISRAGPRRLNCAEIWGGVKDQDVDLCTSGMTASLYSRSCNGGRGGDIYYLSVCGDDRVNRVLLADVVGHGLEVRLISEWVYEQLTAKLDDPDLPGLLVELNDCIMTRGLEAMTTVVVVSYYVDTREIFFCNAGHPPILARRRGAAWEKLLLPASEYHGNANLPLGVSRDIRYEMGSTTLARGDLLFLFTDGILEAQGDQGRLFGPARLEAALKNTHHPDPMQMKEQMRRALQAWSGERPIRDDVTLIAIQTD